MPETPDACVAVFEEILGLVGRGTMIESNFLQMLGLIQQIETHGYLTDPQYWWTQDPELGSAMTTIRGFLDVLKQTFNPGAPILQTITLTARKRTAQAAAGRSPLLVPTLG